MEEREKVISLLEEAYSIRVNNLKRSIELSENALDLSRSLHDDSLTGQSLNNLSLFCMICGEYEKSTKYGREAIGIFENLKDEKGIADAKYNLAGVLYKSDNYHLGLTYLIDCLRIYQKKNDYHNISRTEKSIGTIYEYFGDLNNAVKSYESAISAAKKINDPNLESNAYNNLSGLYLKQNKIELAAGIIDKSVAIKQKSGDTRGYAFAIYGRGKVYSKTGKYAEAEKDYREAMKIHLEMGEKLGLGMAYQKLGALFIETNRLEEAKGIIGEGLVFSNKYNIVIIKFKCEYLLYRIAKLENDYAGALEYLEKYLADKEGVINTQTLKVIENYELISQMKSLEQDAQMQREKAEIIEKKNRAEETARIRQEFLSTMSHEIRTPLNAVISIISLLNDNKDPEEKQLHDSLKFASANLMRIINDILDFTKLDIGKATIENRNVHFKTLLENIWRTYENQSKEKGVKLGLKMDIELADTYVLDDVKISQILGNLISNAIKFTDNGKIEIEVDKLSGDQVQDKIQFKITDTGEGIPADDLVEIFESFSQTKPITTRKQGGTGLGLAIVKKLVELLGGDINVSSTVGKGSVFSFILVFKRSLNQENIKPDFSPKLLGKNALLAEDNQINAFVMRKLLSKWGISIELAVNGKEAVVLAKQKPFDFILMDIHMPEMNGYDAAVTIRKNENPNKDTPIFAITADVTAPTDEIYNLYFNGFLWKPLQIEKLYEVLVNVGKL